MKILDLFCKAGGAAYGYHMAGFDVVGVDIEEQPHYPFTFIKADAIEFLKSRDLSEFDAIHASPPCQRYSKIKSRNSIPADVWNERHPDLIPVVRELLMKTGKPYIIENVPGAPLKSPIHLKGSQFQNLFTQRERLFESNIKLFEKRESPSKHKTLSPEFGISEDGFICICGNRPVRGLSEEQVKLYWGFALGGIDWMNREELAEAIPPCYTEFIGRQMIEWLNNRIVI